MALGAGVGKHTHVPSMPHVYTHRSDPDADYTEVCEGITVKSKKLDPSMPLYAVVQALRAPPALSASAGARGAINETPGSVSVTPLDAGAGRTGTGSRAAMPGHSARAPGGKAVDALAVQATLLEAAATPAGRAKVRAFPQVSSYFSCHVTFLRRVRRAPLTHADLYVQKLTPRFLLLLCTKLLMACTGQHARARPTSDVRVLCRRSYLLGRARRLLLLAIRSPPRMPCRFLRAQTATDVVRRARGRWPLQSLCRTSWRRRGSRPTSARTGCTTTCGMTSASIFQPPRARTSSTRQRNI